MAVTKIIKLLPLAGIACLLSVSAMAQTAPGSAPVAGTMAPIPPGTTAPAEAKASHRKHSRHELLPSDQQFSTESAAAAHCPNSTVEWTALTRSKAYHGSKSRYFGKTKHGAYACKSDLDAAGFHEAKN